MFTERSFLRMQSEAAKARLRRQVGALGDEMLAPLRVRPLVSRQPWLSLAGALLTGFLVAGGLRRRGDRSASAARRWPAPMAALLRQARRFVSGALGAGLMSGWRGVDPVQPSAPAAPASDAAPKA